MLPEQREALLWKLSDLIDANAEELAELESIDNGKTRFMASIIDVPGTRDYFRYMAGWATKIEGRTFQTLDFRRTGPEIPHLHATRAGRRRGADRAVEFPAGHGGLEARHRRSPPAAPASSSPPSRPRSPHCGSAS